MSYNTEFYSSKNQSSQNDPSYLFKHFTNVKEDKFPSKIDISFSFSSFNGMLLATLDQNDNILLIEVYNGNECKIYYNDRKTKFLLNLACNCPRSCLYEILNLTVWIDKNNATTRCNNGNYYTFSIKHSRKIHPFIILPKSTVFKHAHLFLINHKSHPNHLAYSTQMIGCIFDVKYKNSIVKLNVVGQNIISTCPKRYLKQNKNELPSAINHQEDTQTAQTTIQESLNNYKNWLVVLTITISVLFIAIMFIGFNILWKRINKKFRTIDKSINHNTEEECSSNLLDNNENNENMELCSIYIPKIDEKKTTFYFKNILDLPSCDPFNLDYNYGQVTVDQLKQDIAENINGNVQDIILWINKQILTENKFFYGNKETLEVDFVEVKEFIGFTTKKCIAINKLGVEYYNELPCGTRVAAKYFQNVIKDKREQDIRHIMTEIKILKLIGDNENMTKFHSFTRIQHDSLIISNIFVGGELSDYIMEKIKLDDGEITFFLQQILAGLSYIHQKRIIHLDINCDNMLMNKGDKVIKLSEFGAAVILDEGCDYGTEKVNSTPKFMAPELLEGEDRKYTTKADIWSLGCSIIQMATGQLPFTNLSEQAALLRIYKNKTVEYNRMEVSTTIITLINECTKSDLNERPTADGMLNTFRSLFPSTIVVDESCVDKANNLAIPVISKITTK